MKCLTHLALNHWLLCVSFSVFSSIPSVSTLRICPPLPPLLRLDVTNRWICTFLHQNQAAPHHRRVQIWSEHTQNPSAAWWWIGVLGMMFMHQAGALQQMTANCFSDKSLVWDSTDCGWIEHFSWIPWVPGNLVRESWRWLVFNRQGFKDASLWNMWTSTKVTLTRTKVQHTNSKYFHCLLIEYRDRQDAASFLKTITRFCWLQISMKCYKWQNIKVKIYFSSVHN